MKFALIYNDIVVHRFEAADIPAARAEAVAFCRQRMISVVLVGFLRRLTPTLPPPVPPTVDDQPE